MGRLTCDVTTNGPKWIGFLEIMEAILAEYMVVASGLFTLL